ncbi:hypothetical protein LCGC14_2048460 [marine sediment metagenome]|uniref:Uncharacterized protein n=1 Tax=marine sediment metagenome TaxID=412755 RepID=A0A0F9FC87_9ZZZZ
MPIKMNDVVIIGDDGKFTPEFNPGMLGDEYKDSKFFETTPDVSSLLKVAVDTKRAMGKKLEGHIAPLGENPTDEEKATHRKNLMSGLGTVVEKVEDYALAKPENWPEGVPYDGESSKHMSTYLLERGWPKEDVQGLVSVYNKMSLERYVAFKRAEQDTFDTEVKELKVDWKGSALIKKTRTAAKAMIQFGTDELIAAMKESGLVTTPDDFTKWQGLNISAAQIRVWNNIGEAMKSDAAITDEGLTKGDQKAEQKGKLSKIYDHETSKSMT